MSYRRHTHADQCKHNYSHSAYIFCSNLVDVFDTIIFQFFSQCKLPKICKFAIQPLKFLVQNQRHAKFYAVSLFFSLVAHILWCTHCIGGDKLIRGNTFSPEKMTLYPVIRHPLSKKQAIRYTLHKEQKSFPLYAEFFYPYYTRLNTIPTRIQR